MTLGVTLQADLFAVPCPDCTGTGRYLFSFKVRRPGALRVSVEPLDAPLKSGSLCLLPPVGRRRNALWDTHRLAYRQTRKAIERAGDRQWRRCPRCVGSGVLKPEEERAYARWLSWRGVHAEA